MKMTKSEALTVAMNAMTTLADTIDELPEEQREKMDTATEWLSKMKAALDAPRKAETEEKRAAKAAERKEATAKARLELVSTVAPVLRKYLTADVTAKDLYAAAKDELPADFTAAKVQNVLIREMKPELVRTERKKGGDTYRLIEKKG